MEKSRTTCLAYLRSLTLVPGSRNLVGMETLRILFAVLAALYAMLGLAIVGIPLDVSWFVLYVAIAGSLASSAAYVLTYIIEGR